LFWAIPAYIETHGDYWRVGLSEGVGERMVAGLQGHGASTLGWYLLSLPLYLMLFWLSALPWSPLLVVHRKKLFSAWKPDRTDIYLLWNAGIIFLVFSLMVTKLPHYTLPAFPFLALVFARRWISSGLRPALPIRLATGVGVVLVLLMFTVEFVVLPIVTPSPVGELVRDSRETLSPETEFALVDFQEPNAVWEMRRVVNGYAQTIPESEVLSFLDTPGPKAVLISTSMWQRISPRGHRAHFSNVYSRSGFNAAKGTFIDLTLVVKP